MEQIEIATPAPDFAAVFAEHRLGLLRLAVLLVDDVATAEDVVQDAFVGLHRRWDTLREPLPYARTAVVNGCRSVLRRRAVLRRFGGLYEPPGPSAEAAAVLGEERRAVLTALGRLTPRRREVLVLRYYLDLSDAEIAATLSIRPGTVRATVSRALAALATQLNEEES